MPIRRRQSSTPSNAFIASATKAESSARRLQYAFAPPTVDGGNRAGCIEVLGHCPAHGSEQPQCGFRFSRRFCTWANSTGRDCEPAPALQAFLRRRKPLIGPGPVRAVMVARMARRIAAGSSPGGTELGHKDQVALGLAHLLAVQAHHAGVGVVLGQGNAGQRIRMSGTHFVVREDQVRSAALHREGCGKVLLGDDGAFDVPAGTAVTEASRRASSVRRSRATRHSKGSRACRLPARPGSPPRSAKSSSISASPSPDMSPRVQASVASDALPAASTS